MSDDPVKECEVCGEPVKRLLFPVAIQFKGSGFYTTDYAKRSSLGAGSHNSGNGGSSESSAAAEGGGSGDTSKPAAPEAAKADAAAPAAKSD
jgi:predicted nucleic acid-binding Zn ribbon protein